MLPYSGFCLHLDPQTVLAKKETADQKEKKYSSFLDGKILCDKLFCFICYHLQVCSVQVSN